MMGPTGLEPATFKIRGRIAKLRTLVESSGINLKDATSQRKCSDCDRRRGRTGVNRIDHDAKTSSEICPSLADAIVTKQKRLTS